MKLNFSCSGKGEPLILIHGLFGSLENLGVLARALQEDFRVYAIDLPNHGRSPHTDQLDLTLLTRTLEQWMNDQQLATATLIGHSLGGKVAMELALSHPDRVARLAVMDIAPGPCPERNGEVFAALMSLPLENISSRNEAREHLARHGLEAGVQGFLLKNLQRGQDGGFRWRVNLPLLHSNYARLVAANREGRYDSPVLFLKGEHSGYIHEGQRADILARFPAAQLKIVAGAGHWLHADKPELVTALLRRFLMAS